MPEIKLSEPTTFLTISKYWFESKTVWFNILMTFLDTLAMTMALVDTYARQYPDPRWAVVVFALTFLHGFGNIILRVWFTSQPIVGGKHA